MNTLKKIWRTADEFVELMYGELCLAAVFALTGLANVVLKHYLRRRPDREHADILREFEEAERR